MCDGCSSFDEDSIQQGCCWECKYLELSHDNHGLNGFKYYWCPISKTDSIEAVCQVNYCGNFEPKVQINNSKETEDKK